VRPDGRFLREGILGLATKATCVPILCNRRSGEAGRRGSSQLRSVDVRVVVDVRRDAYMKEMYRDAYIMLRWPWPNAIGHA
jgi:hypothetical protein